MTHLKLQVALDEIERLCDRPSPRRSGSTMTGDNRNSRLATFRIPDPTAN
jgi:hypothetical protein